jgi:peroxiredoxin Q/BCP
MSLFGKEPVAVGAEAPAAAVPSHTGETVDLGKLYAEGPVLVYFYPKADTPGCTKQACNLRDNFTDLERAEITVVGVSLDSVDDLKAFQEKYDLPFILVSDKDKALGQGFGVGTYMGMAYKRQSFLVVDGKVAWRDLSARPTTQTADALAAWDEIKPGT